MWKLWVVCALYGAVLPLNQGTESWTCQAISDTNDGRCFNTDDGGNYYACQSGNNINLNKNKFYCEVQPDNGTNSTSWAECSDECIDPDEGVPYEFADESIVGALFCKTVPMECKFPFNHDGGTYHKCTDSLIKNDDTKTQENFKWCATEIDESQNMMSWGKCDMTTCNKNEDDDQPPPSDCPDCIYAEVIFEQNEISGLVNFKQSPGTNLVTVTGTISGLPKGLHGFHVHENPDISDNCNNVGPHFNPTKSQHGGKDADERHAGDFGNIVSDGATTKVDFDVDLNSFGTNLEDLIGKRSLVIHKNKDDEGKKDNEESKKTGNAGQKIACGIITNDKAQSNLIMIIIIVLAVIIVILLILITVLVIYCCKHKSGVKSSSIDGIPYQNGDTKKQPLYDELSIPFIDASPTPTPKGGRSIERLSFFNRTPSIGRSRGSLSMPPLYDPPPPPAMNSRMNSSQEINWKGLRKSSRLSKDLV